MNFLFSILFQGIDKNLATFLLSVIGITNIVGRIACGYIADFPQVNSLLLNNICLIVCSFSLAATPLCYSYGGYVAASVFFGLAICKLLFCLLIHIVYTLISEIIRRSPFL